MSIADPLAILMLVLLAISASAIVWLALIMRGAAEREEKLMKLIAQYEKSSGGA